MRGRKMKTLFAAKTWGAFLCLIMSCAAGFGQTNTGILQVTLDISQLQGSCNLSNADTIYMHSGAGWSSPTAIWEAVVGDWGINDGKGEMTNVGGTIWSICFNVVDYYTNQADPDSTSGGAGSGPMPVGATAYNIGCVFRTASCPLSTVTGKHECTLAQEGKDLNCEDVYILGINDPANISIIDESDGNTFPALTVQYITACATDSAASGIYGPEATVTGLRTFPVPFRQLLTIEFNVVGNVKPKAAIYDLLGQKVQDLSSQVSLGHNSIGWNGRDVNGKALTAGVYFLKVYNNQQAYTAKIIKQ